MENDYETPMKGQNVPGDGASTVAHGLTETRGMAESKLQPQEGQSSSRNEQEDRLDEIEKQISEIGKQLESLHYQMQKQTDKYSENFLNMERLRNQLRKRLIDLDFEHKSIFARRMQESRRLEQEEKQKIRRQFQQKQKIRQQEREERQRRRKQQLDRYEHQYRQKIRATMDNRKGDISQKVSQKPSQQNQDQDSQANEQRRAENQETSKMAQDQLSRSRRRVRIAEIEAELAESRLRRSRNSVLSSQLDYLRLSYSDPYFTYRPYILPSYHYPYSAYPTYSSRWWYY